MSKKIAKWWLLFLFFCICLVIITTQIHEYNQTNKRHADRMVRVNVNGTFNRLLQAYHFEHGTFPSEDNIELKNLVQQLSSNSFYSFTFTIKKDFGKSFLIAKEPVKYGLKNYTGLIYFSKNTKEYKSIICESNEPGGVVIALVKNDNVYCAKGVKKE